VIQPPSRPAPAQSPEARLEQLMNEIVKGEPNAATRLKEHLTLFPGDHGARYLLMRVLQKLGEDTEDLVEGYARETVGSFVNPYIDLGRITKDVGDGTRAMEFYIRSFESSIQAIERLLETARARLASQDFLGTHRTMEVLSSLIPINPVLHATLGEHYLALGDNERAYAELYRAHLAAPDHPVIALKLAASCVKTQRADLALIVLKNLIAREDQASPYRAKAKQIIDSMHARAKRREEERRAQEAEGKEELEDSEPLEPEPKPNRKQSRA
jgi:tetratricopeptide (TPR) repeat protein